MVAADVHVALVIGGKSSFAGTSSISPSSWRHARAALRRHEARQNPFPARPMVHLVELVLLCRALTKGERNSSSSTSALCRCQILLSRYIYVSPRSAIDLH